VIVAALEREVGPLVKSWKRVRRDFEGRKSIFFEADDTVVICGGIGFQAARRASEAAIALYRPSLIQSVGFAGALDPSLHVGDIFCPALIVDARDGSRVPLECGEGTLITFMEVAGAEQKFKLAKAYGAQAIDMEAAAVAAAATAHGIPFGVVKVISDEPDFELPAITPFVDSQGRFNTFEFIRFALLRPWLWPNLILLYRNSDAAARTLSQRLQESFHPGTPLAPSVASSASPAGARK